MGLVTAILLIALGGLAVIGLCAFAAGYVMVRALERFEKRHRSPF